ncbi:MAG: transposase [Candidatus Omnitrophica bacterium]|nr:transposase [Candidatus Omnitrophota bacterium]
MARSLRIKHAGYLYHVISRGIDGLALFKDQQDFQTYVDILNQQRTVFPISIYNYCLELNCVQLLVEPDAEGDLSKFMENVSKAYAKYFNKKYDRSGHVFAGRFKSFIVQSRRYFIACSRYIDLTPAKNENIEEAKKYSWSGFVSLAFGGKSKLKLDEFELYTALGKSSEERQHAYRVLVSNYQGEKLNILNARGRFIGDTDFKRNFRKQLKAENK